MWSGRVESVVWEGCECGLGGWRVWSGRVESVVWEGGECGKVRVGKGEKL